MKRKLIALSGLVAVSTGSATHAEWRRYETAHFIIYSESGDARTAERATALEKIDGLMRMASGLATDTPPVKVRIYELGGESEVQAAYGGANEGVAGFYTNNIFGPYAVTLRHVDFDDGGFTPDAVLHHEYAHHFMLQYFPAEYPAWYIEGYAELIGASKMLPDGKIAYGFPAKYRGNFIAAYWAPLPELLGKPPEKIRPFDLYGQGWALTHFLTFSKTRAPELRQYLASLTVGKSREDAAKAFGDLAALDREAFKYVTAGSFIYRPVDIPVRQPVIQSVSPLSEAEAAMIPETVAFRDYDLRLLKKDQERQREMKRRADLLDRVRAKAGRFANDPYGLYLLAEVETSYGTTAAAEAAVDRLLTIQPNHVRGLVRKSLLLSDAAGKLSGQARLQKAADARALAVKANRLENTEPLGYVAFYESYHSAGLPVPHNALEGLEAAVDQLPGNDRIRRTLVEEYATEHRWAAAIHTLEPIANDPHDSPLRDEARERMAQLEAQLKASGATAA